MKEKIPDLSGLVKASLMAALMVVGAYLKVPIGPVPIVLSNMFVLLAGLLLGGRLGAASVGIYLLLGAAGLPVFSGGGGIARFAGPTGGYLVGYLPAAFLTGIISEKGKGSPVIEIAALFTGALTIYLFGVPWLKQVLELSWERALIMGMLPFLPGDAIKAGIAFGLSRLLHRTIPDFFPALNGERDEFESIK